MYAIPNPNTKRYQNPMQAELLFGMLYADANPPRQSQIREGETLT
jgi:hypothetical protein